MSFAIFNVQVEPYAQMMTKHPRPVLKFERLADALATAEDLAQIQYSGKQLITTGRFFLPQIVEHLARSIDIGLGKSAVTKAPWLLRLIAKRMKNRVLKNGMKPGFRLPAKTQDIFWPNEEVDLSLAMQHYAESISELMSNTTLLEHPYFGEMTRSETELLHCRHAELHLSFVIAD